MKTIDGLHGLCTRVFILYEGYSPGKIMLLYSFDFLFIIFILISESAICKQMR